MNKLANAIYTGAIAWLFGAPMWWVVLAGVISFGLETFIDGIFRNKYQRRTAHEEKISSLIQGMLKKTGE